MNTLAEIVEGQLNEFWKELSPEVGSDQPWLYAPARSGFRSWSWKEIMAEAHCTAAYLMDNGTQPGDTIAVIANASPFYLVVDLALQFLGAVNLTLPMDISQTDLTTVWKSNPFSWLFIEDTNTFQRLNQATHLKQELREIILNSDDVDELAPDKLATFPSIVTQGKVPWREHSDMLKTRKNAIKPTMTYALIYQEKQPLLPVSYEQLIRETEQAEKAISGATGNDHLACLVRPERLLARTQGLLAPMRRKVPVWCMDWKNLDQKSMREIKPKFMVLTPGGLQRLYKEVPSSFLPKPETAGKTLTKAKKIYEKRDAAIAEGKKPSLINNWKYRGLKQGVFSNVRKKLGGKLTHFLLDEGTLPQESADFFRHAGFTFISRS